MAPPIAGVPALSDDEAIPVSLPLVHEPAAVQIPDDLGVIIRVRMNRGQGRPDDRRGNVVNQAEKGEQLVIGWRTCRVK